MSSHPGVPDGLRRAARDLARLVVPVECPGCGRFDELLCAVCARHLRDGPRRCEDGAPRLDRLTEAVRLPVWCLTDYAGPTRQIILAWKDRGRADLTPVLEQAVGRAGHALAPVLAAGLGAASPGGPPRLVGAPGPSGAAGAGGLGLLVVPAPSSAAARRRRGADLVGALAGAVAAGLRAAGVPATSAAVLRQSRGLHDQAGLSARARGRNLAAAVHVRRGAGRVLAPGRPCLLVDDVLTTGATLAACSDALTRTGAVPVGAVVVAATPAPTRSRP